MATILSECIYRTRHEMVRHDVVHHRDVLGL